MTVLASRKPPHLQMVTSIRKLIESDEFTDNINRYVRDITCSDGYSYVQELTDDVFVDSHTGLEYVPIGNVHDNGRFSIDLFVGKSLIATGNGRLNQLQNLSEILRQDASEYLNEIEMQPLNDPDLFLSVLMSEDFLSQLDAVADDVVDGKYSGYGVINSILFRFDGFDLTRYDARVESHSLGAQNSNPFVRIVIHSKSDVVSDINVHVNSAGIYFATDLRAVHGDSCNLRDAFVNMTTQYLGHKAFYLDSCQKVLEIFQEVPEWL